MAQKDFITIDDEHSILDSEAREQGFDIEHIVERKQRQAKEKKTTRGRWGDWKKKPNYIPDVYYRKTPNWIRMHKAGKFEEIPISQEITQQLTDMGFTQAAIISFANMHIEDERLALWSAEKNPNIFLKAKS